VAQHLEMKPVTDVLIFYISKKKLALLTQITAIWAEKIIITLVFNKKRHFYPDENRRKLTSVSQTFLLFLHQLDSSVEVGSWI
jgi:hypothetical protein